MCRFFVYLSVLHFVAGTHKGGLQTRPAQVFRQIKVQNPESVGKPDAFPLRPGGQLNKPPDVAPNIVGAGIKLREVCPGVLPHFPRTHVANKKAIHIGIEHRVGHEIVFVGLLFIQGSQFRRRGLGEHRVERLYSVESARPGEPSADERLGEIADGIETSAGVAVHRGIAHGGLAHVSSRQQHRAVGVGQRPDHERTRPGLDVLQGQIVLFPRHGPPEHVLHRGDGVDGEIRHRNDGTFKPEFLCKRQGGRLSPRRRGRATWKIGRDEKIAEFLAAPRLVQIRIPEGHKSGDENGNHCRIAASGQGQT